MNSSGYNEVNYEELGELVKQVLEDKKTLAQVNNVSESELNNLYVDAVAYYAAEEMDEALTQFTYLVMNNPWNRLYLVGLASCLHAEKQYQNAMVFYGYAAMMDARDAAVTFRIGQCFNSLGMMKEAIEALQTSIDQSYVTPVQPEVRSLAQSALYSIQ